jgi:WD40 repeat protein
MGSRILIASGTGQYDHLAPELQRPELVAVIEKVVDLFTGKMGYTRALQEISSNPSSVALVDKLDEWFASADRDPSDWVVLYYTAHGELDGESLVLLTRDSRDGRLPATSVSAEKLGQILTSKSKSGEKRRIRKCFVILDTCHSGAGALNIAGKLKNFFDEGDAGLFYVLATALPREEAMSGALARALVDSVGDAALGGPQQRLLFLDELEPAINKRLRPHRSFLVRLSSSEEVQEFFPNPRYQPGLPAGATVAEVRRALELGELQTFWSPTSRGVETELHRGWYFTGRERVLRVLSEWLNDPTDDRTRVITGRPGSGKSAIIAKIVTLSDPEFRRTMPQKEVRWSEAFPSECIDLAIHAKGKTFQDVTTRLAAKLAVQPDRSKVLDVLKSREQPFRMIVDALDEAREPDRIAHELLAPLNSIPRVKLLVGTRPEHLEKLGHAAVPLHVDHPDYFEKDDLIEYVTARLLRHGERVATTPYEGDETLACEVSAAVAESAYPNFLIARLVAEDLLESPEALDRLAVRQREFPTTVALAFEHFLERFGADTQKVRDLLTALAWAEGEGLPWGNIWPALASGLSGRTYDDGDIRWLMQSAGSFVVEAIEQNRSVYRLYHQALADYLRHGREIKETQRLVVVDLIATVPPLESGDRKDWPASNPYIRAHLAEHAASCGMLANLVVDPLFLLSADPKRLLSVIEAYSNDVPPEIEHVFKCAFHHLNKPITEAASYLEMTARQSQSTGLADQINKSFHNPAWNAPWASWLPPSTHRILAADIGQVTALAVAERQGRTVIVCGNYLNQTILIRGQAFIRDETISIWDLARAEQLGKLLAGHSRFVTALAVAERQGRTVIVCGSWGETISIWDLERGEQLGELRTGHTQVDALAVAERQGRTVIVSGGKDNSIRIWDLERDQQLGEPLTGHTDGVTALAVAERQGRTVIVSGGNDNSIRIWDLERGQQLGEPLAGHTHGVNALAVVERQGRTVIVSATWDQTIRIWDLERGDQLGELRTGHTYGVDALVVAERQGRTVIVSGGKDKSIRIWDLERGQQLGKPLTGHTGWVNALAVAKRQGQTVIVSGSRDESIRVWDLEWDQHLGEPLTGHTGEVTALAAAERQGRTVIVSGGKDKSVRIWDLERGQHLGEPLTGHSHGVDALAVAEWQGRTVIVSGSWDESIRIWDLERGQQLGEPLTGHTLGVNALAVVERQGRTVIVSGGEDNSICIWDLERGQQLGEPLTGHTDWVDALAVAERQGRTVIVSGSRDASIRIWDLERGQQLGEPLTGHTDGVTALAVVEQQGRTVIVSGGEDDSIRIWDLERGQQLGPLFGHTKKVNALAVAERQGRTVIVSGSEDDSIRIWHLESLRLLRTIDVGAPVLSLTFAQTSTIVVGTSMGLMPICLHRL